MSYTVFARKYRPQTFDEIVGQAHIVQTLKNAIDQQRLAQAYLFVGPRGTGKTSTARIFAKALNCVNAPTTNPCGVCPMCVEIAQGNSMNVLEFDAASNTQVDKIREIIIDTVKYAPAHGKYKLYIVDEVHMLSASSFNALLKTLEEPPAHVKFVFATTDVQKVPTTIISRCQRFDLRRIAAREIAQHLLFIAGKEAIALAPAAADTIARGAEGGLRDAESMLDQLVAFCGHQIDEADVLKIFGFTSAQTVGRLVDDLIAGRAASALAVLHEQAEAGKDMSRLMGDLIEHLRNLLVIQCDPAGVKDELSAEALAALAKQSTRIAAEKLLDLIEQFANAEGRMKWAPNKKMHFEIAAIRAIQSLQQATLTDVLETLTALRSGAALPELAPPPVVRQPAAAPSTPSARLTEAAPIPRASLSAAVIASLEPSAPPLAPPPTKLREEPPTAILERISTPPPISAAEVWPRFVDRLREDKNRGMLCSFVESGQLTEISSGVAVLAFPPDADLARQSCEGKNRTLLESILSSVAGQPLTLRCETRAELIVEKLAPPEPKSAPPTIDPMAEFKDDPLIRKALEIFKATIIPA